MKKILLTILISLPFGIQAQTVDVKDVPAQGDQTTTIEIKKRTGEEIDKKSKAMWEIQDGRADVEGESSATEKEAKAAWKKACDEWKKEFRSDNKDNKIISMSCGLAQCGGEVGQKVCSSRANYKIKTRVD